MALLEVRELTKRFGGVTAIDNLDFDVNSGGILGLIGPNGAGKSTVINVIHGVFRPTKGQISFRGERITGLQTNVIARKSLARTFQQTLLFPNTTTLGNVVLAHFFKTRTGDLGSFLSTTEARHEEEEIKDKSLEIIDFLGLTGFKEELACNLPYGLQKALGIAIAIATKPELLLLDEPAAGMNPEETIHMMGLIQKIRGMGITLLIVEHNMRVVMGLCDRIIVLNFGRKIAEGTPEEIRENKDCIDAYLGVEYVL